MLFASNNGRGLTNYGVVRTKTAVPMIQTQFVKGQNNCHLQKISGGADQTTVTMIQTQLVKGQNNFHLQKISWVGAHKYVAQSNKLNPKWT